MKNQVVISGMGVVTPIGITVEDFWNANLRGASGLTKETRMDVSGLPCGFAAAFIPPEMRRVVLDKWGHPKRSWSDAMLHCCVAQALGDARFEGGLTRPAGLVWSKFWPGAGGSFPDGFAQRLRDLSARHQLVGEHPQALVEYLRASPLPLEIIDQSPFVGEMVDALGVPLIATRLEATCAGGLRAIAEGARLLESGKVDFALVAVAVSRTNHYAVSQYAQLMVLSRWKGASELASTPFDKRRSGMVINESAAVLVLETAEHARRRGLDKVYAVVKGWGLALDAAHITAPSVAMVERVMRAALAKAEVTPDDIDTINAHGTSTKLNDFTEASALHKVFGERMKSIEVSAVKSLTGHGAAASGVVETVAAALTLCRGVIPPVANCTEPDLACGVKTGLTPVVRPVRTVLKNSFGFGGQYASMVFSKPVNPR